MADLINVECKTPANVADTLSKTTCVAKTTSADWKLIILGILAGIYIAFGGAIATLVGCDAAKFVGVGLGRFFTGAVFSVGLMLVVIAGAELFTGNNLMLMGVLEKRVSFRKVMYKWLIVYGANFIGSVIIAYLMYQSNLWRSSDFATGIAALKIATAKVNLLWMEAFIRGILCNILVCLAVWMALASRDVVGKIFAIFFPIMTFVALGFEHSVANMYFIPLGIFLKGTGAVAAAGVDVTNLTWKSFAINNLVPVTLGNIVGGAVVVGMLYWMVYVKDNK